MVGYAELLRQHREIEAHVAALEHFISSSAAKTTPMSRVRTLLKSHLRALHDATTAHFAAEEGGGYFRSVLAARPDLQSRAARLLTQHRRIAVSLESAVDSAEETSPRVLCEEVVEILALLRQHEAAELALVQDATLQDLAAAD